MTEPWFDPIRDSWIPGTVFGIVAVLLGGLAFKLVPQGKAKALIIRSWVLLWTIAAILLGAGVVAWFRGQPWGVWYGLLLPGVVGVGVLGGNLLVIMKKYREVEQMRWARKN